MPERAMGNIFVRAGGRMDALLKKGGVVPWHTHKNFSHVSAILSGGVKAEKKSPEGVVLVEREIYAPAYLLIEAGNAHQFTSLADGTVLHCIYAHRSPQGEVVEEYNGWLDAYV
jgi:quercetin dioxygenase-like cupin family protein